MSNDTQLLALLKASEVEEQRALLQKRDIDNVVEARQLLADQLRKQKEELDARLKDVGNKFRIAALQEQDAAQMQSVTKYAEQLRKTGSVLDKEWQERNQELQRAIERATLAENELVEVRFEKKRLEKLLEERNLQELVLGSAVEDSLIDEMSTHSAARKSKLSIDNS